MNFLRWQEVMGTLFLVLDWWVLTRCFDKLIPSPASNRKTFVRLQRPHSQPPGSLQSLPQDGQDSQYKERRRPPTPGFWRSENACDCSHLAGVRFLHPADQTRAGREWGGQLVGWSWGNFLVVRTSTGASTPPTAPPAWPTTPTSSTRRTGGSRSSSSTSPGYQTWWEATTFSTQPGAATPRLWCRSIFKDV